MTERDPQLDALLAAARADQDPTDADRLRVGASLMAAIAAASPPSTGHADGVGATAAAGAGGTGAVAAKWWIVAVLLAGGGAALTLGGGERRQDAIDQAAAVTPNPGSTQQPSPGDEPPKAAEAAGSRTPVPSIVATRAAGKPGTTPAPSPTQRDVVEAATAATAERSARRRARGGSPRPTPTAVSSSTAADSEGPATPAMPAEAVAPAGAGSSIEELSLIRAATRAITRHDGRTAMRLLDSHRSHHPRGVFALEAQGLRVLALCELGQLAAGKRGQAAFLKRAPHAPLAERVRGACAPAADGQP